MRTTTVRKPSDAMIADALADADAWYSDPRTVALRAELAATKRDNQTLKREERSRRTQLASLRAEVAELRAKLDAGQAEAVADVTGWTEIKPERNNDTNALRAQFGKKPRKRTTRRY